MIRFEDLLEKVRAANPDADTELLRQGLRVLGLRAQGTGPSIGRAVSGPSARGGRHPGRPAARRRRDRRRPAARHRRGHAEHHREDPGAVRRAGGARRRGRDQAVARLQFASSEERQAESFRKMLLAMVDDIRVILVKLADRLHNMRTLHHLPEERRVADRAGDPRHLRADRPPAGHEQAEERARGAGVPAPRAAGLPGAAGRRSRASARPPRG